MDELKAKVQIVINTLGVLEMPPTFNNVNHMYGIYKLLDNIMDSICKEPEPEKTPEPDEEVDT